MNNLRHKLLLACLVTLSLVSFSAGQEPARKTSPPQGRAVRGGQKALPASPEEKVIRATYEKLTLLNRAALLARGDRPITARDEVSVLKFELGNFRVGPLNEIWNAVDSEIKTGGFGEILEIGRSVTQFNKEEEQVAYNAQWATGRYVSGYDRQWTIGDLLSLEPGQYHDVGEYALYDVTVSFEGKTRAYRALALFHNPYRFAGPLKPEFWDSIVGIGGVLTEVWNEKRPPVGQKKSPPATRGTAPGVPEDAPLPKNIAGGGGMVKAFWTESYSSASSLGSISRPTTEDTNEHISGAHGQRVGFRGSCVEQGVQDQFCKVEITDTYDYENGEDSNWFYSHVLRKEAKFETAAGPRGTPITCYAARGIAVRNCLSLSCNFTTSLQVNGGSVQMSGGDVWNGQLIHKQTCNIPAGDSGKCTLAGWDGSCPYGTYPDGVGGCCSGSCDGVAAARAPLDVTPSFARLPDADPCGGTCVYDPETNSCSSPILVDTAGDGFRLSAAANGVPFDLDSDGTPEQLAWTTEGSDDAWLALDRDGDGRVGGGQELFGNYTPQPAPPAGAERNGFLALALYDWPGNGGNSDGRVDARDAIFSSLRLWRDANHNGVSEAGELHALSSFGVTALHLSYAESKRRDEHGNEFRYRAKVADAKGARVNRWAWDVFLARVP